MEELEVDYLMLYMKSQIPLCGWGGYRLICRRAKAAKHLQGTLTPSPIRIALWPPRPHTNSRTIKSQMHRLLGCPHKTLEAEYLRYLAIHLVTLITRDNCSYIMGYSLIRTSEHMSAGTADCVLVIDVPAIVRIRYSNNGKGETQDVLRCCFDR